jgi:hypothetical protein
MDKTVIRVGWGLLVAALAFVFAAVVWAGFTVAFLCTAVRVPGTVVDLKVSYSVDKNGHRSSPSYAPVVEYRTPSGEVQTVTSNVSSSFHIFHVGDPATVLYDPSDPTDARIDAVSILFGGPIFLTVFGAVLAGFGRVVLAFGGWGRRREREVSERLRRGAA